MLPRTVLTHNRNCRMLRGPVRLPVTNGLVKAPAALEGARCRGWRTAATRRLCPVPLVRVCLRGAPTEISSSSQPPIAPSSPASACASAPRGVVAQRQLQPRDAVLRPASTSTSPTRAQRQLGAEPCPRSELTCRQCRARLFGSHREGTRKPFGQDCRVRGLVFGLDPWIPAHQESDGDRSSCTFRHSLDERKSIGCSLSLSNPCESIRAVA